MCFPSLLHTSRFNVSKKVECIAPVKPCKQPPCILVFHVTHKHKLHWMAEASAVVCASGIHSITVAPMDINRRSYTHGRQCPRMFPAHSVLPSNGSRQCTCEPPCKAEWYKRGWTCPTATPSSGSLCGCALCQLWIESGWTCHKKLEDRFVITSYLPPDCSSANHWPPGSVHVVNGLTCNRIFYIPAGSYFSCEEIHTFLDTVSNLAEVTHTVLCFYGFCGLW